MKFLNSLTEDKLPTCVVIAGCEKLVEASSSPAANMDRQFGVTFARVSAILTDFCNFAAAKTGSPVTLHVFSRVSPSQERLLRDKFKLWYSEIWELQGDKIVSKSSDKVQSVEFFLKDNQYYLKSIVCESQNVL